MRLRKDGKPDGRSTNKGTAGNRGGGRWPAGGGLPEDQRRRMRSYLATDDEHEIAKYIASMCKNRPGAAAACAAELGDPVSDRAPADPTRRTRTMRATDGEWQQIAPMLAAVKFDFVRGRQIVKKY